MRQHVSRRNVLLAVAVCLIFAEQRLGIVRGLELTQRITAPQLRTTGSAVLAASVYAADTWPPPPIRFSPPPSSSPPPPPPPPQPQKLVSNGMSSTMAECDQMQTGHNVVIGRSWGSLPSSLQVRWTKMSCDGVLGGRRAPPVMAQASGSSDFLSDYRRNHVRALAGREKQRRLQKEGSVARTTGGSPTVIAVGACTTSRGFKSSARLDELTLFRLMLPSLVSTFNSSMRHPSVLDTLRGTSLGSERVELWIYIAYDAGDGFYDRPEQEAALRAWLDARVVAPLARAGLTARHALLRFENGLRKPGPAFNFMMAAAAEDGADYLYRVNDDTQFVDAWVGRAVRTLRGYSPPNVGVVGPICHEGNTRILTHDLVHRTHLQIFEFYYPPILSDWWMDDWITHVYGSSRFTKGPFLVRHHVSVHGTRYDIDYEHERALRGELDRGSGKVDAWLRAHPDGLAVASVAAEVEKRVRR